VSIALTNCANSGNCFARLTRHSHSHCASRAVVFQPARRFVQIIALVFDLIWQTLYDAAVGVGIILRMIGRAALVNPHGLGLLLTLTFLIAISLLPRLIANYHRKQIIE
jgi:hypothetical protein